jgi:multidrug efflux pump subunit AcrB
MNGAINWFARNSVVANLLMIMIVAAGLLTIPTITKEIFPEFSLDIISISVRYLGAAPEEVEEGVAVRVEEAIQDLEGIKRITSTSTEGVGAVTVELESGTDPREMLNDIKARVDAIDTFPEQTEKPVISEITNRRQVIDVAVSGPVDEVTLKALGQRVRDELTTIKGITQVELVVARPYEVSIEVSEETLRRHNLTFDAVAMAVRRSSLDLPGGSIRTPGGEILLRTKGQAYRGDDFEDLALMTRPDGTRLLLGDVARVVDGFAETDQSARFSGEPAVGIRVYRVGDQSALDIAAKVKEFTKEAQNRMPAGVTLTAWNDFSRILQGRMDLMIRNARNGYILVFIILAFFLKFRLAFWVSLGIPISFLGAFWLMPMAGVTINLISLFAFIVVLGIVVDDAIIVGENIFKHHEQGDAGPSGSARGAISVATPVIFGVLTTIAAFVPLLYVAGMMGKIMRVIPVIVICALAFSLVESLLILPAHLSHIHEPRRAHGLGRIWRRVQTAFAGRVDWFIQRVYEPSLELGVRFRYATVAIATVTLLFTVGLLGAGWIKFVLMPPHPRVSRNPFDTSSHRLGTSRFGHDRARMRGTPVLLPRVTWARWYWNLHHRRIAISRVQRSSGGGGRQPNPFRTLSNSRLHRASSPPASRSTSSSPASTWIIWRLHPRG